MPTNSDQLEIGILRARVEELRTELDLATHKAITCGVAAEHPEIASQGVYIEKWDSPQAQQVRKVVAERDALRARVMELGGIISPRNSIPLEDLLGPIKPCPFCGSVNVFNDDGMAILCRNCDAQAGIMAWQFRAPQN